ELFKQENELEMFLRTFNILIPTTKKEPKEQELEELLKKVNFGIKRKQDGKADQIIAKELMMHALRSKNKIYFTSADKDFVKGFMRLENLTIEGWNEAELFGAKFNREWEKYLNSESHEWLFYRGLLYRHHLFLIELANGKEIEVGIIHVQSKAPNTAFRDLESYIKLQDSLDILVRKLYTNKYLERTRVLVQKLFNENLDLSVFMGNANSTFKQYSQAIKDYKNYRDQLSVETDPEVVKLIHGQINQIQNNLNLHPEIDLEIHEYVYTRIAMNLRLNL
ncbi:MAG: hypothetical protein VX642_12615, partial [Bdellovibrionota bacterium]|nr:hypothetical protein [Bdellovibrionota bacterium]